MANSNKHVHNAKGEEFEVLPLPQPEEYMRLSANGEFSYNERLIREATDPTGVMLKHLIDAIRKECE